MTVCPDKLYMEGPEEVWCAIKLLSFVESFHERCMLKLELVLKPCRRSLK